VGSQALKCGELSWTLCFEVADFFKTRLNIVLRSHNSPT